MPLQFDGTDDVVDHGDITAINGASALTVAYVEEPDTLASAPRRRAAKGTTLTATLVISTVTNADRVAWSLDNMTNFAHLGSALSTGVSRHWLWVYDGTLASTNRVRCYRDGTEQALTFTGTIPTSIGTTTGAMQIGGHATFTHADSMIGHVKIWSVALSSGEAAQEAQSFRPQRTANLLLWSPYHDGTVAADYSGNGRHGTVTGALSTGSEIGAGFPVMVM